MFQVPNVEDKSGITLQNLLTRELTTGKWKRNTYKQVTAWCLWQSVGLNQTWTITSHFPREMTTGHSSAALASPPRFAPLCINKDSLEQRHYFFSCVCALNPTCYSHGAIEAMALSGSGYILYTHDLQQGWLDFFGREWEGRKGEVWKQSWEWQESARQDC